jgi:hypothetical protein
MILRYITENSNGKSFMALKGFGGILWPPTLTSVIEESRKPYIRNIRVRTQVGFFKRLPDRTVPLGRD